MNISACEVNLAVVMGWVEGEGGKGVTVTNVPGWSGNCLIGYGQLREVKASIPFNENVDH